MRLGSLFAAALLALPLGASLARADDNPAPVVFAAASMKTALDAIAAKWQASTGHKVVISYGGSGTEAKQIGDGAPADIFISADPRWIGYLESSHQIDVDTVYNLVGNGLVLVVPKTETRSFSLTDGADLSGFIGKGKLAIGMPPAVPAGTFAHQSLAYLHMWQNLQSQLAEMPDVRSALALVARGEATAGVVYTTDALAEPKVRVLDTFPDDSHDPIIYPAAIVLGPIRYPAGKPAPTNPDALAFLAYLHSPDAEAIYAADGFRILK